MKIYKIKNSEGLFSNGPSFTKQGKMFNTEGGLTNHIIQHPDMFRYMGKDIKLVTMDGIVEIEEPIELVMYDKICNYIKGKELPETLKYNIRQLESIVFEIKKDGYGTKEFWDAWE